MECLADVKFRKTCKIQSSNENKLIIPYLTRHLKEPYSSKCRDFMKRYIKRMLRGSKKQRFLGHELMWFRKNNKKSIC